VIDEKKFYGEITLKKSLTPANIYKKFFLAGIFLFLIILVGTIGYRFIGGKQYSLMDCLYMTVITIATIGFNEVIDLSGNSLGRGFTIFIALLGIGTFTYILSTFTAFIVEGDLNESFRRRKMEKLIKKLKDHYIVCGVEGVGFHIINELYETKRDFLGVDIDRGRIEKVLQSFKDLIYIVGDPTDNETLIKARIKEAKGLFASTNDDNQNLVITLTAKQLNPGIRVIASCNDLKNFEKIKKAGADSVVSPTYIGGLRMASEMVRPAVVSFLNIMMRDKEKNLRVEEVEVPEYFSGRPISELKLRRYPNILLLAVRTKDDWKFNPPEDYNVEKGDFLIFMTTPEERFELERIFLKS